jgi:hypothetical protein
LLDLIDNVAILLPPSGDGSNGKLSISDDESLSDFSSMNFVVSWLLSCFFCCEDLSEFTESVKLSVLAVINLFLFYGEIYPDLIFFS